MSSRSWPGSLRPSRATNDALPLHPGPPTGTVTSARSFLSASNAGTTSSHHRHCTVTGSDQLQGERSSAPSRHRASNTINVKLQVAHHPLTLCRAPHAPVLAFPGNSPASWAGRVKETAVCRQAPSEDRSFRAGGICCRSYHDASTPQLHSHRASMKTVLPASLCVGTYSRVTLGLTSSQQCVRQAPTGSRRSPTMVASLPHRASTAGSSLKPTGTTVQGHPLLGPTPAPTPPAPSSTAPAPAAAAAAASRAPAGAARGASSSASASGAALRPAQSDAATALPDAASVPLLAHGHAQRLITSHRLNSDYNSSTSSSSSSSSTSNGRPSPGCHNNGSSPPFAVTPEQLEVIQSLQGWAQSSLLPLLKSVDDSWQPQDYLPDPAEEGFLEGVAALRERARGLPDDYLVVLVGDMITEECLPTYQSMLNR